MIAALIIGSRIRDDIEEIACDTSQQLIEDTSRVTGDRTSVALGGVVESVTQIFLCVGGSDVTETMKKIQYGK